MVGENKGSKLENLVFSLLRKGLKPNEEIFYYLSNNKEVYFIIKKGRKIITLIRSCFDLSNYQTKEKETKALIRASKELDCHNLLIITSNDEGKK